MPPKAMSRPGYHHVPTLENMGIGTIPTLTFVTFWSGAPSANIKPKGRVNDQDFYKFHYREKREKLDA